MLRIDTRFVLSFQDSLLKLSLRYKNISRDVITRKKFDNVNMKLNNCNTNFASIKETIASAIQLYSSMFLLELFNEAFLDFFTMRYFSFIPIPIENKLAKHEY